MPVSHVASTINHQTLVDGIIRLDEATGLPDDYDSFVAAYRPLILSIADSMGIPPNDREDALQEIQYKFWHKNGLNLYNPEKNTKFATLLRAWATKFMLQERDKVIKRGRMTLVDPAELGDKVNDNSALSKWQTDHEITEWTTKAEKALRSSDNAHLVPVLHVCISAAERGRAPTRAQVAKVTGVSLNKATTLLKQLRTVLTKAGYGIESLQP